MWEILLIVVVFGTILAAFLYTYLLRSPEYKTKKADSPSSAPKGEIDDEALAEKVYNLTEKIENLEADVDNLRSYLRQKVEQSNKNK